MKILHVIGNLAIGGAEKLVVDTVPLQTSLGLTVDVALLDGRETPFKKQLEDSNCCRILDLSYGSPYNLKLIFKLVPLLKEYDIVHVHLFPAQYITVLAKIISRSKTSLLFTEHNTSNTRLRFWIFRVLDQFIYRFYSLIVCISEEVKDALKEKVDLPDTKLRVINNGINLQAIDLCLPHLREYFGFKIDDFLVVMVAAFRNQKDHLCLIKAISILPVKYKLIFIGDGENIVQNKATVESMGLTNRISFWGVRTDVYNILKMCDIGVLSSKWEGFGLAAIEYMACGLPAVVSDVPGLANVVGEAASKFEAGNSCQLAEILTEISNNKQICSLYINRGKKRAENFSLERMVKEEIRLYLDMYDGKI